MPGRARFCPIREGSHATTQPGQGECGQKPGMPGQRMEGRSHHQCTTPACRPFHPSVRLLAPPGTSAVLPNQEVACLSQTCVSSALKPRLDMTLCLLRPLTPRKTVLPVPYRHTCLALPFLAFRVRVCPLAAVQHDISTLDNHRYSVNPPQTYRLSRALPPSEFSCHISIFALPVCLDMLRYYTYPVSRY